MIKKLSNTGYFFILILICNRLQAQQAQGLNSTVAATDFLKSLTAEQSLLVNKQMDDTIRTYWDFVPKEYRAGLVLSSLTEMQKAKFFNLVNATAGPITTDLMKRQFWLEGVLKIVEGRKPEDMHRDPGKYFIQIFNGSHTDKTWGWKLEGHHICINYVLQGNKVVSATPNFFGANPAVVLSGDDQGKQHLKTEAKLANDLRASLTEDQKSKAIISAETPTEIYTYLKRKADVSSTEGILFTELNLSQKTMMREMVLYYVQRSSKLFVKDMMNRIEKSGWDKVRFVWAGSEDMTPGHAHYFRVQGPEFLIEYDNLQNNGNHVHSIFRDALHDFGDGLVDHMMKDH